MKKTALFMLFSALITVNVFSQNTKTVRLDEFLKLGYKGWDYVAGSNAPGGIDIIKEDGENVLKLYGDLTEKGKFAAAAKEVHFDGPYLLEKVILKIKTANSKFATVRLVDVTEQTHQKRNFKLTADGQWHDVELDVAQIAGGEHWKGADDGKWHDPLKEIWIALSKKSSDDAKPVIFIKDVRAIVKVPGTVDAEVYSEDFEKSGKLPEGWTVEGDVKVVSENAFQGKNCLKMARTEANALTQTTIADSAPFKAGPGKWTLSGAGKCDLYSPDLSFTVYIFVNWLDKGKQVIRKDEITILNKKQTWKSFTKKIEAPEGTAFGQFFFKMHKTYGEAFLDDLKAVPPAEKKAVDLGKVYRIECDSEEEGNLFHPGTPVKINVELQAKKPLTPAEQELDCSITDYWGAEIVKPFKIKLPLKKAEKGLLKYQEVLDLKALTGKDFEEGKYYELHLTVNQEGLEPYREMTTFAIVPDPITKKYPYKDIPFTARNWDNRVMDYITLADRIGIRQVTVYSKWDPAPPYKPMVYAGKKLEKMDIGLIGRSPLFTVEREGFKEFTEEGIAQGAKNWIEKFGTPNMLWLYLGNEPHGGLEKAKENVKAYKAAYEAIKKVRPDFQMIGTSIGPNEDYFKAGFQNYLDVYDFHTYGDYDIFPKIFAKYEEMFKKYGGKKPICSTEIGLNAQGMDRQFIAQDLIKKVTIFLACGGAHIGWFTICFPDREGTTEKSSRQAFNVFFGKYAKFNPRLDAVSYYHILNSMCIKKIADQKVYEDGTRCYLFKDKDNKFLQVVWNDKENKDVFLPLSASGKVKVIRIDGRSRELTPDGGITINVSRDPVIITYDNGQPNLPEKLGVPQIAVKERPGSLIKGTSQDLIANGPGLKADQLEIIAPLNWQVATSQAGADTVKINLAAPQKTSAKEAKVAILRKNDQGIVADLNLGIKVASRVGARLMPIASNQPGGPGVKLIIYNNGDEKQNVSWSVSMNESMPMVMGSYDLVKPIESEAYFKTASSGEVEVNGKEEKVFDLAIDNVSPVTIYRIKAELKDNEGKSINSERLMGGFAGAAEAKTPVKLDGILDDADWQRSSLNKIDDICQYMFWAKYNQPWTGKDDLSADLRFLWDKDFLYVGVEVTDDVFVNPKCDDSLWAMDGLQFLVDPARSGSIRAGKYDFSMGVGSKGPQAWYHMTADPANAPAGEAKDIKIAYKRGEKGNITYEIAIPWNRLSPFKPQLGADLGLAMVINETDEGIRGAYMAWFSGVHLKEADMVGDVILTE